MEMPAALSSGSVAPVGMRAALRGGRGGFLPQLCGAIIAESGHPFESSTVDLTDVLNDVLGVVSAQVRNLPLRIRWKLALGLFVFRVMVFFISGRTFESLSTLEQVSLVKRFSYRSIYPYRMLFRAVRALTLFAYFEQPDVVRSLSAQAHRPVVSSFRR